MSRRKITLLLVLLVGWVLPNSSFLRSLLPSQGKIKNQKLVLASQKSKDPVIDFVLDLDWTLIYKLDGKPDADQKNIFKYEEETYRLTDGTREFIEALLNIPGARISFFSGGSAERNHSLLSQIKLSDGRSLKEIATDKLIQPGSLAKRERTRIFSFNDLEDLSEKDPKRAEPGVAFSERYKKDLRRVAPDVDFNRVVLIDDINNFALQPKHTLWLQDTYKFADNFQEHSSHMGQKYIPKTELSWALERNKLAWALGIILKSTEMSAREKKPFIDCMNKLVHDSKDNLLGRESEEQRRFYLLGLEKLKEMNRDYQPPSISGKSCRDTFNLSGKCLDPIQRTSKSDKRWNFSNRAIKFNTMKLQGQLSC